MRCTINLILLTASLAAVALFPSAANAEAVWHCSRAPEYQATASQDEFKLSSFDAVAVTLQDLMDVYQGHDVRVGQLPLNACFMPGNDALSQDALRSLGLKSQVMQKLAARSAIVRSNLHAVHDEEQMMVCMERNFPTFGYLSKEVATEKVVPCF